MLFAMRSRCSLYVDAGYLLASAATRVTGTSLRNGIHVEYAPLIKALVQHAETISELSVLRVHWYDSAKDGVPDGRQERIGELPKVKLRLGRIGMDGEQKGVDLRIGLDLVAHARNGAADVFFLVSGDDDLTEAVEEAQVHGVQVVLLAVPNPENKPHGVSRHLVRAADGLETLSGEIVDKTVMKVEVPPPTPPAQSLVAVVSPARVPAKPTPLAVAAIGRPAVGAPSSVLAYSTATGGGTQVVAASADPDEFREQIDSVVTNVLTAFRKSGTAEALAELQAGRPSIPRDIDKALLTDLSDRLGVYDLSDPVRYTLRARFWAKYDEAA
jgi:uncharacterized LabA/DUF88 family protein